MEDVEVMNKLRDFISNNYLYSKETDGLEGDTSLINKGVIDSTGVLELIDFLEEEFQIEIENGEIIPENLDTINNMINFLKTKR